MVTFQRRVSKWVPATLLGLVLLGASGCLISSDSKETQSGAYVPQSTFAQIEPGKTTIAWVKATMGEPTTKANVDDHVVWTYSYTEHIDSSGAVFLIFGGHSERDTPHKAYVEFKDGVVVNKWNG